MVTLTALGNIGRYINHSCDPNLIMIPVRVESMVPHLALFVRRKVNKGDELCFDYGDLYRKPLTADGGTEKSDSDRTRCLCDSSKCAGVLPYDSQLF